MKARSLLPLFAACTLSACLPNAADAVQASTPAKALRSKFAATSLESFALSYGSTLSTPYQAVRSQDGLASTMLCPLLDGTRKAVLVTWPDAIGAGLRPVDVSGYLTRELRGEVRGGVVRYKDVNLASVPECKIPALADNWPVVVIPMRAGGEAPIESYREEIQASSCPAGFSGATLQRRMVKFSTDAAPVAGEWKDVEGAAGCIKALTVGVEMERKPMQAWDTHRAVPINTLLMANSPTDCVEATVTATKTGEEPESYTMTTCNQVAFAPPPPPPACPGAITLPPMSSKAEYASAVMPYEALLKTLPADCEVTITSDAHWPIWVTFNIEAANRAKLVRSYLARLPMKWTGRGGMDAFNFAAWSWRSIWQVPDWLTSDQYHWLMVKWTGADTGLVYSMNGRGYWDFLGPNTVPAQGTMASYNPGRAPVPYKNEGANPWGNTPEQTAKAHGFSYDAFASRHYRLEGAF